MPQVTSRQAVGITIAVAILAFANALFNGWAGDDLAIVRDNPLAHSVGAAIGARFSSYWPPPFQAAGLYRPLVILSYAIDWTIAGGRPWAFHLNNVVLHALTSGLVTLLALRWLSPLGALASGLMFAVHPVHVEAVSNVIGRAEVFAGMALLGALVCARRFRSHPDQGRAVVWGAAAVLCVTAGLLVKEHAVVAVALLLLDQWVDPVKFVRRSGRLILAVSAVTIGWLFIWRSIAGGLVGAGSTSAFFGLSSPQRLATMLPAQFDVVRLLAWPFELSSDYSPQVIPVLTGWTVVALAGGVVALSVTLLGGLTVRRAPAVSFGILVAAITYLPTSNIVFPSGVMLAERALYLAALAPALTAGWLVERSANSRWQPPVFLAVGVLLVTFCVRDVTRTPFWSSPTNPVIEEAVDHPESYRAHLLLGDLLLRAQDSSKALSEYLTAGALFERDPYVAMYAVRLASLMGRTRVALSEARRAVALAPDHPTMVRALVFAQVETGLRDSAVITARTAAERHPNSPDFQETLAGALRATAAPPIAGNLVQARVAWLSIRPAESAALIDSSLEQLQHGRLGANGCAELSASLGLIGALKPRLLPVARLALERCRQRG